MSIPKKMLILCTGNSCRSQIAHGYFSAFAGNQLDIYSAGIESHGLDPRAVQVMREDGVDISNHTSNDVAAYSGMNFEFVLTVCDKAREQCPYFPSIVRTFHQDFPDPAKATGTEEEIMTAFRTTRDMIKSYVQEFVKKYVNVSS
jgi:arsenate reductase (thioredoxin)